LQATVLPAEATNKELSWSVIQGSGTATISQGGLLRGGSPGEVQVVATAQDGSGTADTLTVPVLDPLVPVSSISISTQGGAGSVMVGESLQCFATVSPAEASNQSVIWSLINLSGTASISTNGLVTGLTPGNVQVIATAEDGSQVADTITLSISDGFIYVTDIVISSAGGATEVFVGAELQFSATVLPVDATDPEVVWSVIQDAGTASINTLGRLTGGNPGGVRVVATATDGSAVADTFSLTVVPPAIPVTSIVISSAGGAFLTVTTSIGFGFSPLNSSVLSKST